MYQAPDGKHQFANFHAIEDADVCDRRLQHIKGKTSGYLSPMEFEAKAALA